MSLEEADTAVQSVIITSLPPGKPVQQVFTDPSTGIVAAVG